MKKALENAAVILIMIGFLAGFISLAFLIVHATNPDFFIERLQEHSSAPFTAKETLYIKHKLMMQPLVILGISLGVVMVGCLIRCRKH